MGRVASSDWSPGWNVPGPPTSLPGGGFGFLGTKVLHTHGSGRSKPEDKVYPGQPSGGRVRKPAPEISRALPVHILLLLL